MNVAVIFSLCTLLTLPVTARIFTSITGKTIEAEIIAATDQSVTLKLSSGKTSKATLDKFSKADQAHVKAWLADKLPDVRVTPKFVRANRDAGATSSSFFFDDDRKVQVLDLSVHLETWDKARGVEGEIKYVLVGRSLAKRGQHKILAVQSADFTLAPAGQANVDFKTVKNYYEDGDYSTRGARCIGYVLYACRKSDGREVYSSASTPVLGNAIHSIIALKTGEETDENFIKIPNPRRSKKGKDADVITIK
jgi:hypothetical protein